ncbi:hypothetical protein NBO_375g0005 [Nosema bombycis CQ1]|uniref:Uncharacterized protein n=1 Tax=Nosema bombycis (strain CQ1 / CVCC 102059) TaxID=578461 RepID=R0KR90_NOSB1|nr:hypothetical protein NBO_375g0005 [Nosema bombycis CQ1]|eukprot:EOB12727.1 hypothetical protein NBO_375g0005 [Nosema bombycis CQ1]
MKESKYFFEYLNNENPFAFLKGYEKNKFNDPNVKKRLDSIQKMQPKFIPCTLDPGILSKEHNHAMNKIIKDGINQDINQGLNILLRNKVVFDQNAFLQGKTDTNPPGDTALRFCDVGYDSDHKNFDFDLPKIDHILEIFKNNLNLENMKDIVIEIYRLKLFNKQNIIRNRVYDAIKDKLDDENIASIDFNKPIEKEFNGSNRF